MLAHLESAFVKTQAHVLFTRRGREGGPPVVFVHGLGTSSRYMVPTARRLVDAFSVYAPDLPGFGLSSKPEQALSLDAQAEVLAEWMTALDLSSAAMVGNSVGCQVIARFGTLHPERLTRAILLGPTMDAADRTAPGQFWRFLRDLPRERVLEYAVNSYDYWRCGFPRLLEAFRLALADRIEDRLPGLSMPVLIVRGMHDPIVSAPWARHLAGLLPNGRFVTTRGAHTPNFSEPGSFSQVVRWYLRTAARSLVRTS